ncbi:DUF4373 domain-containing protein [Isosphaeraceae bacterium EP7]
MARPRKTGLDYFPLDCVLDEKVRMLECEFGNDGFAVWIKILQAAYQTEHGEVDFSGVIRRKTFAKLANISEERFTQIIELSVEINLFDKSLWKDREILTSPGIKSRIDSVSADRKRARERMESSPCTPTSKKRRVRVKVKENPPLFGEKPPNNSEGENPFVLEPLEHQTKGRKTQITRKASTARTPSDTIRALAEDHPLPSSLDTPLCRQVLEEWVEYKVQMKSPYAPIGLRNLISHWEPMGADRFIAAARNSMSNNWQGLVEPRSKGPSPGGFGNGSVHPGIDNSVEAIRARCGRSPKDDPNVIDVTPRRPQ